MNAEKFFNTHSIEEISKKTKISPISLRLIRNKEFDKISKVKFLGFLNIIQKTYNVDLSDLIEEYHTQTPKKEPQISIKKQKKNKNSTFFIAVLALIMIILGGLLLFNRLNSQKNAIVANNIPIIKKQILISSQIKNKPQKIIDTNTSLNQTKEINNSIKSLKNIKENNLTQKFKIIIIPNKLLWFKAVNIDTNKSVQYLTTHQKILPKGNYYIKFGHGDFNLTYNNQTITPNTNKVIRILFKNGTYKFMKKPNRFEK